MDRKAIDKALETYIKDADQQSVARLEFFSELWRIQEKEAAKIAEGQSYNTPATDEVVQRYWSGRAVFEDYPVRINVDDFARVCNRVAEHLGEHAGLEESVMDALAQVDWESVAHIADLQLAGSNPPEFVEQCLQTIDVFDLPSELPASIFMMVPAWALRAFLDLPAQAVMEEMDFTVEGDHSHGHALVCPVCGTPATASCVSEASAIQGGERSLYCSTCGTVWPFERIRCARCGTQNPSSLHWFHIEGDEAYRMQNCSECKNYIRTAFEDETPVAITSMEVEDVVMVALDAVAQQGAQNA